MDGDGEWVWVRRPAEAEAVAAAAGWPTAEEEARPLEVVFASPSRYFTDAAPIGNGSLGALVWGGVASEKLQLNREYLDSPSSSLAHPRMMLLLLLLLWFGSTIGGDSLMNCLIWGW